MPESSAKDPHNSFLTSFYVAYGIFSNLNHPCIYLCAIVGSPASQAFKIEYNHKLALALKMDRAVRKSL
jgi:hypothetical protein